MFISIQEDDFDVSVLSKKLNPRDPKVGAITSFCGIVRDFGDSSDVEKLHLEHYPGMTEKCLERIAEQALARFAITDVVIVHRVGELKVTDNIVYTAVVGAHRQAAFDACQYIMDYLKTEAPFWKKEITSQGACWVNAKESDDVAKKRWLA